MVKVSVDELTGSMETLLIPLWARAHELRQPRAVLRDVRAGQLIDAIDYDFDAFASKRVDSLGFCVRAAIFDGLVRDFLSQHRGTTCVEIGVGLDTRWHRLQPEVPWFELDFPEIIRLRRRLLGDRAGCQMLSMSALDFRWLDAVAQTGTQSVFVVIEGVFYFWTPRQIRDCLEAIAERFPGARVAFDAHGPLYRMYSNCRHPLKGSRLGWSLRSPRQIEAWDPSFRVERFIGFGDQPQYDAYMHRFSGATRCARRFVPFVRQAFKIVQVRLG